MNREILFRGKRLDNGQWVYSRSIMQFINDGDKVIYMLEFNKECTYEMDEGGNILSINRAEFYNVDPETVGQYVGYIDIWGNHKFEDDIFECDDERYIIAWDEDEAKFVAQGVFSSDVLDLGEFYPNDIYVIGNIHDNPELGGCEND